MRDPSNVFMTTYRVFSIIHTFEFFTEIPKKYNIHFYNYIRLKE